MKTRASLTAAALAALLLGYELYGQVPPIITYQGRVQANGTNFIGPGQFKFALVDVGSNSTRQATATAIVSGGFLIGYTITDGGSGYTTPPQVMVSDAIGSGATAMAHLSGGVVTNIQATSAGNSYSGSTTVTIEPPPPNLVYQTLWSNDGTSNGGTEPALPVGATVQEGAFTVHMGDTNQPNMTAIPTSAFDRGDVHLRIWFNDGINGFAQLIPDQRITSVGYAMRAEAASTALQAGIAAFASSVQWADITGIPSQFNDGIDNDTTYSAGSGLSLSGTTLSVQSLGITSSHLAADSVVSSKIAPNSVTSSKLANNSVSSSHITSGAVGSQELDDDSVTADHLANDTNSIGKLTGNVIRRVGPDIGINTATPTARLDVVGRVRLRGSSSDMGLNIVPFQGIAIGDTNEFFSLQKALYVKGNTEVVGEFGISQGTNGFKFEVDEEGFLELWRVNLRTNGASSSRRMVINRNGDLGLGTIGTPLAKLHVDSGGNTPQVLVAQDLAGNFARVRYSVNNSNLWEINAGGNANDLHFYYVPAANNRMTLDASGDVFIDGALNASSDRTAKQDFDTVNAEAVLEKVAALPIQTWAYQNSPETRHIGPAAQDFHSAFGFGSDEKHIASVDADGVALVAIQGLNRKLEEELKRRDQENATLKRELGEIKRMLTELNRNAR